MEGIAKRMANPVPVTRLLMARTDGRTNGRATHLKEKSSSSVTHGRKAEFKSVKA